MKTIAGTDRVTRMTRIDSLRYGVWLLGVRWASGWNCIPKAKRRSYSLWV